MLKESEREREKLRERERESGWVMGERSRVSGKIEGF